MVTGQALKDGARNLGEAYQLDQQKLDKTQFKVGSLDQLMELMDIFAKADLLLDASCKRNEKMYFEMCKTLDKEAKLRIEVEQRRGAAKSMPIE
jgi:hypothetical protein